jgi:hypothetical protein
VHRQTAAFHATRRFSSKAAIPGVLVPSGRDSRIHAKTAARALRIPRHNGCTHLGWHTDSYPARALGELGQLVTSWYLAFASSRRRVPPGRSVGAVGEHVHNGPTRFAKHEASNSPFLVA